MFCLCHQILTVCSFDCLAAPAWPIQIERLNRLRNRRALDCQRAFRGFLGREQYEMAKMQLARESRACTRIQANWRMSRILPWQGIKMNKTAAFVFRREELEMDERAAAADERNARRIELAIRDSASDTEEEDVEEYWNEFWDDVKDCQAWSSTRTGEVVWEEPLPQFAVEMSMLHRYVRIYWPANDEWFRAIVSRFNKVISCSYYQRGKKRLSVIHSVVQEVGKLCMR